MDTDETQMLLTGDGADVRELPCGELNLHPYAKFADVLSVFHLCFICG
jgi:hypothetical protein